MTDILVRNLDPRVVDRHKLKAELKGRSLQQELHDVITRTAPLSPDEKVALVRRLRAKTPPLKDFDVRAAIRYGRDDEFD